MGEERLLKMFVFFGEVDGFVGVVVPEAEAEAEAGSVRRWTRWRQSLSSESVWWSKGSRLLRTVPEKRTGSWS